MRPNHSLALGHAGLRSLIAPSVLRTGELSRYPPWLELLSHLGNRMALSGLRVMPLKLKTLGSRVENPSGT